MIPAIIQEAHNSKIAGHGGAFQKAERIREVIWWPTIDKDVRDHVDRCPSCGACPHNSKTPAKADGTLPQCTAPNQRVHVDLFGPLKTSEQGHKFFLVYTMLSQDYVG